MQNQDEEKRGEIRGEKMKKGPAEIEREERERERKLEMVLAEREMALEEEERVVYEWSAPARAYKARTKEFYTTIGAIVILLSVILFFAQEFLLIGVILSLAFASYVFASVKPEEVIHQITTRGVRSGGKYFRWDELLRFWFSERFGQKLIMIETAVPFPRVMVMLVGESSEEKLKELLRKFVLHETPDPGFLDKAAKWLSKKVPLEE